MPLDAQWLLLVGFGGVALWTGRALARGVERRRERHA